MDTLTDVNKPVDVEVFKAENISFRARTETQGILGESQRMNTGVTTTYCLNKCALCLNHLISAYDLFIPLVQMV